MNIEVTTSPADEDARTISQELVNFNHEANTALHREEKELTFFVFARDEYEEIRGGVRATCFWNTLHIELVWVSEEARGHGIGSELIEHAEQFAREHGYELALLETTSWQAKPFYEKAGYELMGTLPDYPKGSAMHFMTKRLEGERFTR